MPRPLQKRVNKSRRSTARSKILGNWFHSHRSHRRQSAKSAANHNFRDDLWNSSDSIRWTMKHTSAESWPWKKAMLARNLSPSKVVGKCVGKIRVPEFCSFFSFSFFFTALLVLTCLHGLARAVNQCGVVWYENPLQTDLFPCRKQTGDKTCGMLTLDTSSCSIKLPLFNTHAHKANAFTCRPSRGKRKRIKVECNYWILKLVDFRISVRKLNRRNVPTVLKRRLIDELTKSSIEKRFKIFRTMWVCWCDCMSIRIIINEHFLSFMDNMAGVILGVFHAYRVCITDRHTHTHTRMRKIKRHSL